MEEMYFMGRQSNLKSRKIVEPIIVGVDAITEHHFSNHLAKYKISFNNFVKVLKRIVDAEIIDITRKGQDGVYRISFENGVIAYFQWKKNRTSSMYSYPEFILDIGITRYECNLADKDTIFSIERSVGEFSYKVIGSSERWVLYFLRENNYVARIEFAKSNLEFFDLIPNKLREFNCDCMPNFFAWFKSLIKSDISNISIEIHPSKGWNTETLEIHNGEAKQYSVVLNRHGKKEMYSYDASGDWVADAMGVKVEYSAAGNVYKSSFKKNELIHNIRTTEGIIITIMTEIKEEFDVIKKINTSFN